MTSFMLRRLPTKQPTLLTPMPINCHFRLGFVINLQKSALVPFQVMPHLVGLNPSIRLVLSYLQHFHVWTLNIPLFLAVSLPYIHA